MKNDLINSCSYWSINEQMLIPFISISRRRSTSLKTCKLFSTYFLSVYLPALQGTLLAQPFNIHFFFSNCSLSLEAIEMKLIALNSNKGCGPDEVTPSALSSAINTILKLSLSKGIFPAVFRDKYALPIWKNSDHCDAKNYKPISPVCPW